ncbi:MAG: winged helix-turn-helix domain-containing protein [Acidimicrobiia bacterium]|nr:winged helix-turn-helix domain-containing protein [Acidimicrobiia bacterium]
MFRVLGGVAVELDDTDLPLTGQASLLLGILLAGRGQLVPINVIIDRLWSGTPPRTATKVVHVVVGRLRRALDDAGLGPCITTVGAGYRLDPHTTDLDEYLAAVGRADRNARDDDGLALAELDRALALWRGRPWGDQADEEWLRPTVDSLEEQHRQVEERWADLALACGRAPDVVDRFVQAARAEPLRERRWGQAMLALYRAGRQAEALRLYDEGRTLLRDQLGLEPGPELRRLQLAVLQQEPGLSAPGGGERPGTSLIGRFDELTRLEAALGRSRLVTVSGLGGMGKTRLVAEVAHRQRLRGATTWWASLATLPSPERAVGHVVAELGLHVDEGADPFDVLVAAVGGAEGIFVVDAAERAPSETTALALRLLDRCPAVRMCVASRVELGVPDERVLHIGPLDEEDAFQLLVGRLGIDEDELAPATRGVLASRLASAAGVPLLIEVVARTVDPAAPPADPTTTSPAPAPLDHRDAVRGAIGEALDSVEPLARRLASAAAPLPAGVSEELGASLLGMDAATARRALRQLAWVRLVDPVTARGPLRYRSLDPVREALVHELDAAQLAATLDGGAGALASAFRALRTDGMAVIVDRLDGLEDEHDNLRFLLAHHLEASPARALELAVAGCEFWRVRHVVEGREWLERAIEAARPTGELRWRAEYSLARTTRTFGEVSVLRERLEAVLAEMDHEGVTDQRLLGSVLMYVAMARGWQGDREGCLAVMGRAAEVSERYGTAWSDAQLEQLRILYRALTGDIAGARIAQREWTVGMEAVGDAVSAASGWYLAASLGEMTGETDLAEEIGRGREHAVRVGDVSLLGRLLLVEARMLVRTGDGRGRDVLDAAADELTQLGGLRAAALARRDLGLLELADGEDGPAARHLGLALPALLTLDRPASALAAAGLAHLAHRSGDESGAATLVAAASGLRRSGGSGSPQDEVRLEQVLADLGTPQVATTPDDGELVALADGLTHRL